MPKLHLLLKHPGLFWKLHGKVTDWAIFGDVVVVVRWKLV